MALALYRKYRPRTFAEVIGQEHVTEPLTQALRSGRLNHAYLFSGPRGCGKTSSARILARSLNCAQGPTPEPCGTCESCRSLANDGAGSIDVIEIDAASHGGVDDARDLRERAFFAPVSSRFKVYVIDEAHMVSTQGFNALLKLVEEPPDYVKFIFATTEPDKVLGTIRSRTHHYPFRLIPPGVLRPYLEQLCAAEGVKVEPAVFPLVVRAGGGSARDSLSLLDQLIAGAGAEGVNYARAVALLGVTDAGLIDEMCDALAAGDGAAAYATIDRVAEAGHDPRRFAADLLERLRDLIVLQQVPDAVTKGLLDAPADQLERMSSQASRIGPATLSRCADIVHNGLVEMRGTTAPRLLLELVCARMLLPGAEDSTGALLQRLERMERRLTITGGDAPPATEPAGRPAPPKVTPSPAPVDAPPIEADSPPVESASPAPPVESAPVETPAVSVPPEAIMPDPVTREPDPPGTAAPGTLDAAAVRRVWDEILGMVSRKSKRDAAVVREATVREVDGETLVLTFRHSVHAEMLTKAPERLLEAVYEVLGGRWEIRCEFAGDQRPAAPAPRTASSPAAVAPATTAAPADPPAGQQGQVPTQSADTDWPEAARPGGSAPDGASSQPGGSAPGGESSPPPSATTPGPASQAAPVRGGSGQAASGRGGSGQAGSGYGGSGQAGSGQGGSGRAAARAAASGRSSSPDGGVPPARGTGSGRGGGAPGRGGAARGRGGSASAPPSGSAWGDGPPPDEPPYDPDYDGPVRGPARFDGFDPGDEPLDDVVDEATARQTSEQQALQLLQQTLGAEKIGEVDAR